jgi:methylated-DNA-[protein]-cysteine S-methyltransferase
MKTLYTDRLESPLGEIILVVDGATMVALEYADFEARMNDLLKQRYGAFQLAQKENPFGYGDHLAAYFKGDLKAIETIPAEGGGTPFQKQVWLALRNIAVGTVMTYGGLAKQLGQPQAARAVGYANSQNPIGIVVPCHRVIGSGQHLTGYAGGLARKAWLLRHEGLGHLAALRAWQEGEAQAEQGRQLPLI